MNRLKELDQAKAIALILGIFLIITKLTLSEYSSWNPGNASFNSFADWIFLFESYSQMAIIYFSAYLSYHIEININFLIRNFIKLVLISSFIFIHGLEFIKIHWSIIQSLFFYYLIFYSLKKSNYPFLLGTMIAALSLGSIPFESELKTSPIGFFLFGTFAETNSFSINNGIICAILSYFSLHFKLKPCVKILIALLGLSVTFSYFMLYNFTYKLPVLSTTFSGFLLGFLIVDFFKKYNFNFLEILGKNSFYSYISSWLIIHWIVIWNNLFWHSESSPAIPTLFTLFFVYLIYFINKKGNLWKKIK